MTTPDYVSEQTIRLDHLHKSPDNPREEAGDVTELAASIRSHGLLQSLLVRPAHDKAKGHYYIEAGFRRWTACRLGTDLEEVRCRVWDRSDQMDPRQHSLEVGLIENIHRDELDPIEKAHAFGRLMRDHGRTQKQIADSVGLTDATVNYYLTLLELDAGSQARVKAGKVRVSDAVDAVRASRRKDRKKKGHKPVNVRWEPDHFTVNHPLARQASVMCDARGHTRRRRLGKKMPFAGACGQCWETAIRQDQDVISAVKKDLGDAASGILTDAVKGGPNHR